MTTSLGELGVELFDGLVRTGRITLAGGLGLTPDGRAWFTALGGPEAVRERASRPLLRTCLDWTERRSHLGGALGAVLLSELLVRRWVVPDAHHRRALAVTDEGRAALNELLTPAQVDNDPRGAPG